MKIKSKIFYWYAAFVIAYAGLLLLPAPDTVALHKYHLSPAGLRGLDLTIIIIEAVIWFAAFYGYMQLHRYSRLLKGDKDGKPVFKLAQGLLLLSLGLPLSAIISSILSIIASHNPSFMAPAVVIKNYIGLLFPLAAFLWINVACRELSEFAKTRPRLRIMNTVVLLVIVLGVVFCSLISNGHTALRAAYHMSPAMVMLTVAIPSMYTWFLGLFAIAELHAYSNKVAGVVFRPGWNRFAAGLAFIVLLSIVIQYLTTLSSWLTHLSLGWILLLLYVLLFLLASAYIVVALGTKRLIKIEEV